MRAFNIIIWVGLMHVSVRVLSWNFSNHNIGMAIVAFVAIIVLILMAISAITKIK